MSRLAHLPRLVAVLLLAVATPAFVSAVNPVPFTEYVTFSVRGTGSGQASMTVYGESTQSAVVSLGGSAAEAANNVALKPGEQYTVNFVGGSSTGEYWLGYVAPEGYYLLVDNAVASMSHLENVGSGYSRSYIIELRKRANAGGAPFSVFSGIQVGKSITWEVGLGTKGTGQSANIITFKEDDLSLPGNPIAVSKLMWAPPPNYGELRVEYDPNDPTCVRQITVPSGFVDMVDGSGSNNYWLKFYRHSDIEGNPNGLDFPKNQSPPIQPWKTIHVEQAASNQLKVTVTEGSVSEVSFLYLASGTLSSGNYTWILKEGGLDTNSNEVWLRTTSHVSTAVTGGREVLITVYDGDGTSGPVASVTKQVYEDFAWGEHLVQTIQDPAGAALTTTLAYHEDSSDLGNYRRVKSVTQPTGAWKAMWYYDDWDKRGQLQYDYAPFKSSPSAAPSLLSQSAAQTSLSSGVTNEYTYVEDWTGKHARVSLQTTKTNNVQTGKSTWSYTDINGNGHDWNKVDVTQTSFRDNANGITQRSIRYRADAGADAPGFLVLAEQAGISRSVRSVMPGTYDVNDHDCAEFGGGWTGYLRYITLNGVKNATGTSTSVSSWDGQSVDAVHMEPNRSTMDVVITLAGKPLRSEKYVYTGSGFSLLTWSENRYDDYWRNTETEDHLGNLAINEYSGGRVAIQFGADGSRTDFTYDYLGRVYQSSLDGVSSRGSIILAGGGFGQNYPGQSDVVTTYTYDGANRVVATAVASGSLSSSTSSTYDLAGRVLTQSAPAPHGGVFTTAYAYADGGRTVTVTNPGGATQTTTAFLDGKASTVSGSAVISQAYDYAIFTGGNLVVETTMGGNADSAFETEYDWLGNRIEERHPGWNGTGTRVSTWDYNNQGQLTKSTATGVADTLLFYDSLGYHYRTVVDVNGNGTVEIGGTDRITDTQQYFSSSDLPYTGWAVVQITNAYLTDSSSTPTQISKTAASVSVIDGDYLNYVKAIDIFGNITTSFEQRWPSTQTVLRTVDTPASNQTAREAYYAGRKVETLSDTGFRVNYDYDDFGRLTRQTHPRLGRDSAGNPINNFYGYNLTTYYGSTGFVESVTDHSGVTRQTTTYDAAGRVATVTNAEGGIVRTAYNTRGQPTHTWGDATYPIEHIYDPSTGQRTIMKTYRGDDEAPVNWNTTAWPGAGLTADLTVWAYDSHTGLLNHKYDAKNVTSTGTPITNAKSVAYTYNLAGQIATRTWARGVVTTYTYDSITGELVDVDYGDSTPDITNVYNRQGLLASVTRGTETTTYDYCVCGKVAAEHLGSTHENRHLIHHFDTTGTGTKGRTIGYTLTDNATTPNTLQSAAYTYDSTGRFDTLTTSGDTGAHVVDYAYVANSSLLAGYTVDGTNTNHFTFNKGWHPNRNLVTGTSTTWGASTPTVAAGFAYAYDDMNRRMTAVQTGIAFEDYGTATHRRYDYNVRSEVIGDYSYANGDATATNPTDPMADRAFEFTYDDLGNRISSNRTGNPGLAETYARNELNQYTSRSYDTLTASGTVANSSVKVAARIKNDSLGAGGPWVVADRVANYWSTSLVPRNADDATRDTVDVVAVDPGAGSGGAHRVQRDATRKTKLPESGVTIFYDDDGNITDDGLWKYEWDAENRLVAMETATPAWQFGGTDRVRYVHTYDHLHRRIRTRTHWWAGYWFQVKTNTFLYHGWNVIRESINDTDLGANYVRSYAWGLDIMGSLSGSAGVQGLVTMRDTYTSTTYLPGYDANGNVVVLLDASDGSLEAAYEYGPYGELLRQEGAYATQNPFQFSTKYTDEGTGLSYYGRRYYDPRNGRFLGRDPIEEEGGNNLYRFGPNSPVNGFDVNGEYWHHYWGVIRIDVTYYTVFIDGHYYTWGEAKPVEGWRQVWIDDPVPPAWPNPATTPTGGGNGGGPKSNTRPGCPTARTYGVFSKLNGYNEIYRALVPEAYQNVIVSPKHKALAQLADAVYGREIPDGWSEVDPSSIQGLGSVKFSDPTSGFHAALYRNDSSGEMVVAFEGTDFKSLEDWTNNLRQGYGLASDQYEQAMNLAVAVNNAVGPGGVTFTGHSLGGGLATAAALATDRQAVTFNAAGVHSETLARRGLSTDAADYLVTAYAVRGEILNSIQDNNPIQAIPIFKALGIAPGALGQRISLDPKMDGGPVAQHGMDHVLASLDCP